MTNSTRSIDELIAGDSGDLLSRLLLQGHRLMALEQRLHGVLDPELAREVRVAGLDRGCLVLVTPRAGIAMRLRLEAAELGRAMRDAGVPGVREVRVRVAPLPEATARKRTSTALPGAAVEALERFARDHGYDSLERLLQADSEGDGVSS